ncbi:MAG: hypothetical protein IJ109_10865 [Firmicutes bacterium]|nr:hypothetical protein [Bacillota bacterium]MBQ9016598.1 hypothetical protein [Bacillota bacterium]
METNIELRAFQSTLDLILELEKRKSEILKRELAGLPKGRLRIVPRRNKLYFQSVRDGHVQGITKDLALVYQLARKEYLQLLLESRKISMMLVYHATGEEMQEWGMTEKQQRQAKSASGVRRMLEEALTPIEELLDKYGKAGLDVLHITCSQEQIRWVKEEYRRNNLHPEQRKFETYSGIKVRSKSEQSIGNALEIRGIPYRYEPEISLEVGWMDGVTGGVFGTGGKRYKNYYPDFVIRTADGQYIIWEHLGRIHEDGYRAHNMEKIAAYRQGGLCDDNHLILTFERDLVKLEKLDELIRRRVQPYM